MSRYMYMSMHEEDDDKVEKIAVALSTKTRRDILRLVDGQSYSVSDIAQKLELPMSTAAFHVKHLHEADLIHVQERPASRGVTKIISRKVDEMVLRCKGVEENADVVSTNLQIPISSYTDCKAEPTCGMASTERMIGVDDQPGIFFSLERREAQIIWIAKGFLEYRVGNYFLKGQQAKELLLSLELCSEAPNYQNDWSSDITFWVNGYELCTWTSPGDFGGRRGRLNPSWWPDVSTQYGLLKNIRINERGVYLDEQKMTSIDINQLHIEDGDYFTFRIGVKEDANNPGGFNIFGEKFGDYEQAINVRIEHETKKEAKRGNE